MSKPKPYCARTLRYVARVLDSQAGQFFKVMKVCTTPQGIDHWQQLSAEYHVQSLRFARVARAIERKARKP